MLSSINWAINSQFSKVPSHIYIRYSSISFMFVFIIGHKTFSNYFLTYTQEGFTDITPKDTLSYRSSNWMWCCIGVIYVTRNYNCLGKFFTEKLSFRTMANWKARPSRLGTVVILGGLLLVLALLRLISAELIGYRSIYICKFAGNLSVLQGKVNTNFFFLMTLWKWGRCCSLLYCGWLKVGVVHAN